MLGFPFKRDEESAADEHRLAEREDHEASEIDLIDILDDELFVFLDFHTVLRCGAVDFLCGKELDQSVASGAVN